MQIDLFVKPIGHFNICSYSNINFGPEEALAHFSKGDREDPYLWYLQSRAWSEKGEAAKAAEWKQKVLRCNQNSLELASARRLVAQ